MHTDGPSVGGQVFRQRPPDTLGCAGNKDDIVHALDVAGLRDCANIALIYGLQFYAKHLYNPRQLLKVKNNFPDATFTLNAFTLNSSCVNRAHIAGSCAIHRRFGGQRTND